MSWNRPFTLGATLSLALLLCACRSEISGQCGPGPTGPARLVVRFDEVHQTIEGIGASSAFQPRGLTDGEADLFFSPERGVGLSLLRLRIAEDGGLGGGAWSDAAKASARGARVWAVPWSAPGAWKDNDDDFDGGRLCAGPGQGVCAEGHYGDWADRLAAFPALLREQAGVDLYALSVQNEPDVVATYDSMVLSPRELAAFAKVLRPKLAAYEPRPKLVVGEYGDWSRLPPLVAAVAADPEAMEAVDAFAAHQYAGVAASAGPPPRPVWQTEYSRFHDRFDPSIEMGLVAAQAAHDAFTFGDASAWHWWWLTNTAADDNQGLVGRPSDPSAPTKRLFAVGNFSRFVRPGWQRVGVVGEGPGFAASAFRDSATGDFAVVIENCSTTGPISLEVDVSGAGVDGVEAWVTSGTALGAIGTDGNLSAGSASAGLPASIPAPGGILRATVPYGVVTFVGRAPRA
jgi:O-glycosyl hydrolase